ncbi:uncharacterized protein J3R85_015705 [Psidium guajava]|nr:uncharacterized protein J3R85_015705 [Psidium guajava]
MGRLLESLRSVVQSPPDLGFATYALKEQMMAFTPSIFVSAVGSPFLSRGESLSQPWRAVESLGFLLEIVKNRDGL